MTTFTATDILSRIRYDPLTKKGSVYDVIQLVTNCASKHAATIWDRITDKFSDVGEQVTPFKFPGQGQRPTPVADLPTLFRIMAILPGSRSRRFAAKSMDVFTRAFAGDERLEPELKKRRKLLDGTHYQDAAARVNTTVEDCLEELDKPMEPVEDVGVLYIATSPLQSYFKLGFWTGTEEALRSRYRAYYGPDLELHLWPCEQCRACEAWLLEEFSEHSVGGELFDKICMPDVVKLLDVALRI